MARVNLKSKEVWLLDGGEAKKPSYIVRVTHVGYQIHYEKKDGSEHVACANLSDLKDLERQVARIRKYGGKVVKTCRILKDRFLVRLYDPYFRTVLMKSSLLESFPTDGIAVGYKMLKEREAEISHREYGYINPAPFQKAGRRGSHG
ncbi:hypothetical protein [Bdellovibrio sp. BCCA]|uniref:hypothetical protein n=1 Tax=Bdellovibrio sp. BCCA TaxID=3136281 RepID=UPI0030F12D53